MTRRAKNNVEQMDDEVMKCFVHPTTGKETTTPKERRQVAERWCAGDYEFHHEVARKYGLLPIALIIAALIDIDHPLLTSGRGVAYNSLQCSILIIQVMEERATVAQPVEIDSLHSLPVERIN